MSMSEWVEWRGAMSERGQKRRAPHQFTRRLKRLPWPYCAHCGLMLLKNEASKRAAKAVCEWEE